MIVCTYRIYKHLGVGSNNIVKNNKQLWCNHQTEGVCFLKLNDNNIKKTDNPKNEKR